MVHRCHQDQLQSWLVASTSDPVGFVTTEESPLPSSDLIADVGDSEPPGPNPQMFTTQTSTYSFCAHLSLSCEESSGKVRTKSLTATNTNFDLCLLCVAMTLFCITCVCTLN